MTPKRKRDLRRVTALALEVSKELRIIVSILPLVAVAMRAHEVPAAAPVETPRSCPDCGREDGSKCR